jgi:iron only hydrogenase large subunit-like protein
MAVQIDPLVQSVPEKCKVCYTCVRECPAKAIRILDGQAEVVAERCIGCGNCVKVCTRGAKKARVNISDVKTLLESGRRVAAVVAPSFPAEFPDIPPKKLVGMLIRLGFHPVTEVAFGADMVAHAYRELLRKNPDRQYIAVNCPAVVTYIEKYMPQLVPYLAPIVSPMTAEARVVRTFYGEDTAVVFIGPCIAKKDEAPDELDQVLTFIELRELFAEKGITPDGVEEAQFNPPSPGLGAIFPISGGMLQAADMKEDLVAGDIVTAEGRAGFLEALKEFENDDMDPRLLELLCCDGCIMGPGMSSKAPIFRRRAKISHYARSRLNEINFNNWNVAMDRSSAINLDRTFSEKDTRLTSPGEEDVQDILCRMGKSTPEDELNCGACGYDTCREHAVAILKGLAESEMCLPYAIDQLKLTVDELAGTRVALKHAEKMAGMGQLAAGIAHKMNNPLGVVLMYAHTLLDERAKEDPELAEDLKTIAAHADRCKKIVAGLLDFARQNKVSRRDTDLPVFASKVAGDLPRPVGVELLVENRMKDPMVSVDDDQFAQVVINLVQNAYQVMNEGGKLVLSFEDRDNRVIMKVTDNGAGISPENMKKIFEPFFTTKPRGKGTGLGLAVTYGIVKMHRGSITAVSNIDPEKGPTGTTFTVTLPRRVSEEEGRNHNGAESDHTAGG